MTNWNFLNNALGGWQIDTFSNNVLGGWKIEIFSNNVQGGWKIEKLSNNALGGKVVPEGWAVHLMLAVIFSITPFL